MGIGKIIKDSHPLKLMRKILNVSIGIPAYNEEKNILHILQSLRNQNEASFKIKEIFIYSDGSTDDTVRLIKSVKDSRIKLIIDKIRKGQQFRQNQILKAFSGDILIILEADTLPYNEKCLEYLIEPYLKENNPRLGMVVGSGQSIKPTNFLEKILYQGSEIKKKIFKNWKNGNNVYVCGGHSMKALSRKFTDNLIWPVDVPEDAYAYFRLKELGLEFKRQQEAKSYMRNTRTMPDRIRQVTKFLSGKKSLEKYFPPNLITAEYTIPKKLIFRTVAQELLGNPFWTILYLFEVIINRVLALFKKKIFNPLYQPYISSKNLIESEIFNYKSLKTYITIGIPAYNEEKNIKHLLKSLLSQNQNSIKIKEILVYSDGSSDRTVQFAKSLGSHLVKVSEGKDRTGKIAIQNKMIKEFSGKILVILDADILPTDNNFLENLVRPIIRRKADLVSAQAIPLPPKNFFEYVINTGVEVKEAILKEGLNDNNVLLCMGRARAFSKRICRDLIWPDSPGEDAYSYFYCLKKHFKFRYVTDARVYYRSPQTYTDHLRQSIRFINSKSNMEKYFDAKYIQVSYRMKYSTIIKASLPLILKKPISLISYFGLYLSVQLLLLTKLYSNSSVRWNISPSSKKLR